MTSWWIYELSAVLIQGGEQRRFAMPIPLRADYDAEMVRSAAKRSKDGPQARRLLALAAIYEGATRTEAAKIGGVTLQIVRIGCEAERSARPQGSGPAVASQRRAPRRARCDHRERPDPGGSWGGALADCRSLSMDLRGIPRGCRQADVGPRIAAMGYRKLSARPRHHAQATGAIEDFKKAFPRAWKRSGARRASSPAP